MAERKRIGMAERKRIGMKHVQLKEWLEYLVKTERAKAELRKRLEKADARNHPEWDEMDSEQAAQKCIVDLLEMLKC